MSTPSKKNQGASGQPPTGSVGRRLHDRRQERELSLKQVELATRIRGKYLVAIEGDDYRALPHDVYTRGFIQSYANFLGLDGRKISEQYMSERGDQVVELSRPRQLLSAASFLSPRLLTLAGIAAVLILVVGYLFWQFSALTAPPRLEVKNPDRDQVLYGSLIKVDGNVGGGADVYVNDSPILSDASGNFTDSIALQDGVNAIRITAKNRLGKKTIVTRNILAHVPKTDASSMLPGAVFPGVAIGIQIKDAAAAITIRADDKEVFHGTMLPGTVQTFKANSKLVLSTSNAGATTVTVTNSTSANRSLGAVGPLGQPKKNLEFDSDTQFQ